MGRSALDGLLSVGLGAQTIEFGTRDVEPALQPSGGGFLAEIAAATMAGSDALYGSSSGLAFLCAFLCAAPNA